MDNKNFGFKTLYGFLIFIVAVMALGLLTVVGVFFLQRDNTVRIEKVTEKQVYLENSALITAVDAIARSMVTIVPASALEKRVNTVSALTYWCVEEPDKCRETGLVLTSDGLVVFGGGLRSQTVDKLRAVANNGEIYELTLKDELDGFVLYQLVAEGQKGLPIDERRKFFNIPPVSVNGLGGVSPGQQVLTVGKFLIEPQEVSQGIVSELHRNDLFISDMTKTESPVTLAFSGFNMEKNMAVADLGGQLVALWNNEGKMLNGEEVTTMLRRLLANPDDVSPVNLGLQCFRLDKTFSDRLELEVDYGCLVADEIRADYSVVAGGLGVGQVAEKIGIKPGDVILEVDNNPLSETNMADLIRAKAHGEAVQFTVFRNGKSLVLNGTL